ncbi:unnamed protein product [Victoria cruziana]
MPLCCKAHLARRDLSNERPFAMQQVLSITRRHIFGIKSNGWVIEDTKEQVVIMLISIDVGCISLSSCGSLLKGSAAEEIWMLLPWGPSGCCNIFLLLPNQSLNIGHLEGV